MNILIDSPIFLARQQEQRKLPKILACGIGGSLVFHGIAAIAFNYLPQQSPVPVEVTLIDPSEIPADLKPSPSPTITPATPEVKPTPAPVAKTTPAPSVKAKPDPSPTPVAKTTPTPLVKVKPEPTPTPVIKTTPTPTPSVKVKPEPTPQTVKIITKPVVPVVPTQKTPKKLDSNDLSQQQDLANTPFQKSRDRQSSADSVTPSNKKRSITTDSNKNDFTQRILRDQSSASRQSSLPENDRGGLSNGEQLSRRDAARSNKIANLFGKESNSSASQELNQNENLFNDASNPGRRDNSQANRGMGENGSIGTGGNSQSLIAGRTGSQSFDRFGGNNGSPAGGEGDESAASSDPSPGGGSSRSGRSSDVNGQGVSGQSLAAGRTGGGLAGLTGDGVNGDGDSLAIALVPGGNGGSSRSSLSGTGDTDGNGSSLKLGRGGGKPSGFGNVSGSDFGGDGDGLVQNGAPGTNISRSGGIVQTSKGFGSGLECISCDLLPFVTQEVNDMRVVAIITLNDNGNVIAVKLPKPTENQEVNNYTQESFRRMRFRLPATVTKRSFSVSLNFEKKSAN